MTTNSQDNNNNNEMDGYVAFHLPRKIPLAILFAFFIQIGVGIWAVSYFYFEQKELQT